MTQPWPLYPQTLGWSRDSNLGIKRSRDSSLPTRSPTQNCQDDDIISIFFWYMWTFQWLHLSTLKMHPTSPRIQVLFGLPWRGWEVLLGRIRPKDFMDGRHLKLKGNTEAFFLLGAAGSGRVFFGKKDGQKTRGFYEDSQQKNHTNLARDSGIHFSCQKMEDGRGPQSW